MKQKMQPGKGLVESRRPEEQVLKYFHSSERENICRMLKIYSDETPAED